MHTLGPGAKRNHLDVTFYVREKGRMHLGVSAHAGTQSGDAVCTSNFNMSHAQFLFNLSE